MLMTLFSDCKILTHVESNFKNKFVMIYLRHLHYFLGNQVLQTKEGICISHSKYSCDLLCFFHMDDYKSTPSPFQSRVKKISTYTMPKVDITLYR